MRKTEPSLASKNGPCPSASSHCAIQHRQEKDAAPPTNSSSRPSRRQLCLWMASSGLSTSSSWRQQERRSTPHMRCSALGTTGGEPRRLVQGQCETHHGAVWPSVAPVSLISLSPPALRCRRSLFSTVVWLTLK